MRYAKLAVVPIIFGLTVGATTRAPSLKGSRASVLRMYNVAIAENFTFLRTVEEVHDFYKKKLLVRIAGNEHYALDGVGYPYARPAVKLFLERFSAQYESACGNNLIITGLTRPLSKQPRNASPNSVHPTGMGIDIRVSTRGACRAWLEKTLLYLEGRGVLEVTREKHPPHYHVAVFPTAYTEYVKAKKKK